MVELCPKEVQKPSKERVRRQGKSTVDVGGKKNTLTLPRLRLRFLPRKLRRVIGDQPPLARSSRSSWVILEWIQSPWIQPFGRPVREEDPPRLVAFPFDLAVAFFARSRAAVFSFTMAADEGREEQLCGGESGRSGRRQREQRENAEVLFKDPCRAPL